MIPTHAVVSVLRARAFTFTVLGRRLPLAPILLYLAGCAAEAPPAASAPVVVTAASSAPATPAPVLVRAAPAAPVAATLPAADDKFAKIEIKVRNVAGNVFMLQAEGAGNIGVLVGDDGIVIVDDQFAPLAGKIRAALKGISDKPIKFVINTHWHPDHTDGNAVFGAEGPIVAQENVRKKLLTREVAKEALPVVTFEDNVSIHIDGEDIRAIHYPGGHTDGDAIIFFPKANVVHMGDDFVTYGYPVIDFSNGGSIRGMIAAADRAVAELPADVKVIPGHGDVSTLEDVKQFSAVLKDCVRLVEGEVKLKKTLAQAKADKPLAKHEKLATEWVTSDNFVELIYKELTAKKPAPAKAPLPRAGR